MKKCGTDIIEVNRIKEALDKKGFKERIYTSYQHDSQKEIYNLLIL